MKIKTRIVIEEKNPNLEYYAVATALFPFWDSPSWNTRAGAYGKNPEEAKGKAIEKLKEQYQAKKTTEVIKVNFEKNV